MIDKEKRNRRQYEWQKEQKDRINLLLPKGYREKLRQVSAEEELSISEFIRLAVDERISRHTDQNEASDSNSGRWVGDQLIWGSTAREVKNMRLNMQKSIIKKSK